MSKNMVLRGVCGLAVLVTVLAAPAAKAAGDKSLAKANRLARHEALTELRTSLGRAEFATTIHRVKGLAKLGLNVGPLCIGIAGECRTQRELGYHSSEYFMIDGVGEIPKAGIYTSIAEARFPGESYGKAYAFCEQNHVGLMNLFVALETKERLEHAFLASYTRRNPNTAAHTDAGIHHTYRWSIDEDGRIVELDHAEGDGD